jgi:hypothetical protein
MIFLTMTANNRFGTPDPAKEETKERFSQENQNKQDGIINEKNQRKTRLDYKGKRKQVGFRLPLEIINDLSFLQFATRETQSSICEEALKSELEKRKEQLKNEGEEEYNQLIKLFEKKR